MRFVSNFEIIIKRSITQELRQEIRQLKKWYPAAFLEGGIGRTGRLKDNFGARYIIDNGLEGVFVLHKLIELSKGFYEAYARVFVSNSDIPTIKYCNGQRDHKTFYTMDEICPICKRKTKKARVLTKECREQLREFKVSIDEL